MKPYLYILAVLLVGGGIGYYVGQKTIEWEKTGAKYQQSTEGDSPSIQAVIQRLVEAYSLHDAMLLFRDCSSSYVETNGNTGESLSLQQAVLYYYESFRSGKSVNFLVKDLDIKISKNMAVVRAPYSKTSDAYEKEEIKGKVGEGLWLLSKSDGRWKINAFSWTEESRN